MKKLIFYTIVIFTSCSTQKQEAGQNVENVEAKDTTISSTTTVLADVDAFDFPLDSLLGFDSEKDLRKTFGDNIKRSTGYYPEGMGEFSMTLLFPGTMNEVEFVWLDDSVNFSGLSYVNVSSKKTNWKTKEGITIGTTLKDLEKLNEKPFHFYGFGWDYSGLTSWDNGHLRDRGIGVTLDYPSDKIEPGHEELISDQDFQSDSELAQQANPIVSELTMRRIAIGAKL